MLNRPVRTFLVRNLLEQGSSVELIELIYSNINNLNLKYFINDIISTFPEYKDVLELYYDDVLEDGVCSNDKYVKRFMRKLSEFKTLISNKDNELFSNSVLILKNVDFKTIWESEELSEDNYENEVS